MSRSSVFESRRARSGAVTGRHILSSLVRSIELWLIRHQGRQDLNSLGDHLLKDIGISREDIGISREDALWTVGKPFRRL
jgi:uncharacterized protein YjiS (DUF1127 family)